MKRATLVPAILVVLMLTACAGKWKVGEAVTITNPNFPKSFLVGEIKEFKEVYERLTQHTDEETWTRDEAKGEAVIVPNNTKLKILELKRDKPPLARVEVTAEGPLKGKSGWVNQEWLNKT